MSVCSIDQHSVAAGIWRLILQPNAKPITVAWEGGGRRWNRWDGPVPSYVDVACSGAEMTDSKPSSVSTTVEQYVTTKQPLISQNRHPLTHLFSLCFRKPHIITVRPNANKFATFARLNL
jgi:hypothetical protein